MSEQKDSKYSATASAIGYLYQCRYALLESLRRLRISTEFIAGIETLDDVVFQDRGEPPDLLQTKHHLNRVASLTDASPDLWKTIRIWSEHIAADSLPSGTTFYLITTAIASEGTAASYLRGKQSRDEAKALERLSATAESSTSKDNLPAYTAFRSLSQTQKEILLHSIVVIDSAPSIENIDDELRKEVYFAVEQKYIESFLQRLEGWWFRRVIRNLAKTDTNPIISEEINDEMTQLREQFKQDNLPIDEDIVKTAVEASGYQDRKFVHQLNLIKISNNRILHAIRNYFRAYEQRSRWIREDLLLVGELEKYEDQLIEEWDILFEQIKQEMGEDAAEEIKRSMAQKLYSWIETGTHRPIRTGCTEPFIARGSYQILSDEMRVGWHPEYRELLKHLLEPEEARK